MKIKLVGALPQMLRDMGLKPGECYEAEPAPFTTLGAVQFKIVRNGEEEFATVWPENYKKI